MDPITAGMLVTSAISGFSSLFGRHKAKHYTKADLVNMGYEPMDTSKLKTDIQMDANSLLGEKRDTINEKLISKGYDPAGAIGAHDKDISGNMFSAFNKVDSMKAQEDKRMNDTITQLNMNEQAKEDNQENPVSQVLGTGLQTYNALSGIRNSLKTPNTGSNGISIDDLLNYLRTKQ